jgi:hypothetical protein
MPPLHDCKQSNHRQPPAHCRVAPHCRPFVLKADNEVKWGLSAFASLLVGVCPQLHRDVRFGVRVAQGGQTRYLRSRPEDFLAYVIQFIPLEVNMVLRNLRVLFCLLILNESTLAQAKCFRTVSELKANNVRTRWQETTHNDRKPLTISITDGANGLVYSAKKAGLLWLTGNVSVCRSGGATEITLKNTQATSNVPMLARLALPSTQSAHIVNDQIKLAGGGWGGTFIGH